MESLLCRMPISVTHAWWEGIPLNENGWWDLWLDWANRVKYDHLVILTRWNIVISFRQVECGSHHPISIPIPVFFGIHSRCTFVRPPNMVPWMGAIVFDSLARVSRLHFKISRCVAN